MLPQPVVVRLRNWIGDVVLGLPALELLAAHGHAPCLVARGGWAPALLAAYDWPVQVQPQRLADKVRQLRALRRRCRGDDAGFDARDNALVLPASWSSAFEMRLAGLRAVGVAHEGRSPLLARAVAAAATGHEVARFMALACDFLQLPHRPPPPAAISLRVSAAAGAAARALLRTSGVDGPYAVICPFAAGRAATAAKQPKKWPAFPGFTRALRAAFGLPVLVYPGPTERDEAQALYGDCRVLAGGDIGVYAALLQGAALVVANDTGPGHLAAAVGAPLVSVLGGAYAERWAPYGPTVAIVQRGERDRSVVWPTVDEVLDVASRQLAAGVIAP